MIEANKFFILISSTLIICYVSGLFYSKTKIPDIIWALFFGILLGPILGYFEKDLFMTLSPIMSTLALNIILFEAGITLDIKLLKGAIVKSALLSISTIFVVIIAVGIALTTLFPNSFTILEGMLVGAMVGGTSTIAVYSIVDRLGEVIPAIESTRCILIMESVISDPICIITSMTLIKMIITPETLIIDGFKEEVFTFVFSAVIGFIVGVLWSEILNKLEGRSFNYMMTLAILFPTYIIADLSIGEGGGVIAVLLFGLIISNYSKIMTKFHLNRNVQVNVPKLQEFHAEITFFIKSFFFVYMGLIVTISVEYFLIGLGVLALILLLRYLLVTAIGGALKLSRTEKILTRTIYASGLPAFIMAQLPLIFDPNQQYFSNPEIYPNLTLPLVLANILLVALISPLIAKKQLRETS